VGACCEGVDVVPCWTRLQVVVVVRCQMLWARATHYRLTAGERRGWSTNAGSKTGPRASCISTTDSGHLKPAQVTNADVQACSRKR
jgi:hypothetical protein